EPVLLGHERCRRRAQAGEQHAYVLGERRDEVAAEAERLGALVDPPEEQPEVDQRTDLVEPELELGDDAEVAAPAPERPEEVGILGRRRTQDIAPGRDDLGDEEVVDGQAGLARQPAHPAAEREPADPSVADEAAGDGQAVRLGGAVQVAPGRATATDGPARRRVDRDLAHPAEVDHQPALADRVAAEVVAAAAHRDLQSLLTAEPDRGGDLGGAGAARDRGRVAIDVTVPDRAGRVIFRVGRRDHLAREPRPKDVDFAVAYLNHGYPRPPFEFGAGAPAGRLPINAAIAGGVARLVVEPAAISPKAV